MELYINGDHYRNDKGIDLFDLCKKNNLVSGIEYEGFLKLNIFKYIIRFKKKGGINDLYKARNYLDELINYMEKDMNRLNKSRGD